MPLTVDGGYRQPLVPPTQRVFTPAAQGPTLELRRSIGPDAALRAVWRANAVSANARPVAVNRGPNEFALQIDGPDPLLAVGGNHNQQEFQRDKTIEFAARAALSYGTGHSGVPRWPNDASVRDTLAGLNPDPPIGRDGVDVTHAIYTSDIPNATPQQVYQHFVEHPNEVFNAGGMEIRPPTAKLENGGRYMLETGAPPTWLPVEIRLDPTQHAITIKTLDGHVLRGEQTFTFSGNGTGGSTLTQDARFQASSKLVGDLQQLASVSAGQHRAWQNAHREIYEQFNGNANYAGIGIHAFNKEQWRAALDALKSVAQHPGSAADAVIDVFGEFDNAALDAGGRLGNWAIDHTGELIGAAMDKAGIPGGGVARAAADKLGDGVSWTADKAGDGVSWTADKVGDGAKKVIDFLT
jgi:hypothetical protein